MLLFLFTSAVIAVCVGIAFLLVFFNQLAIVTGAKVPEKHPGPINEFPPKAEIDAEDPTSF
jgi:hypothetical protein